MDVELQHKDDKDTSKVVQQRRWRKVSIGEKFATVLVVVFHSLSIQVGMKRVVMFNAAFNYRIKIGKIGYRRAVGGQQEQCKTIA